MFDVHAAIYRMYWIGGSSTSAKNCNVEMVRHRLSGMTHTLHAIMPATDDIRANSKDLVHLFYAHVDAGVLRMWAAEEGEDDEHLYTLAADLLERHEHMDPWESARVFVEALG